MLKKITFTDKQDILGLASIDDKNKITAQDVNDIKNAINNNTDELDRIKVNKAGSTMTGALNFAANKWNNFGTNVAVGAINVNGTLGIKGLDGPTAIQLVTQGASSNTDGVKWTCNKNGDSTISGTLHSNFNGPLTGNADTATKLKTARTINDTSFDGTANITTTKWGTARNIYIADADNTNTGAAVSVNGGGNATLKLPATIKASLTGNADTTTKLKTARTINGTLFDGTANITTDYWGSIRDITISDNSAANTGPVTHVNGSTNYNIKLPSTIVATLKGNADTATNATNDGNGNNIINTYRRIADSYTKNEIDNKFSTLESAIDWKESVDTYDDIATKYPNPQDGWTVNTKDTDYTYRYSGNAWIPISANAIPKVTSSVDGLMTKELYDKLANIQNGSTRVLVDSSMSATSTNPVQNKVVQSALDTKLPLAGGVMTGNINFNNRGASYIGNGNNDSANGVGGALNNLVISSWWGVSFTTSCPGQAYSNTNAVSIDCRSGEVMAAKFSGPLNGNANTASKLASARNIALTGAVTGNANFDGSGNININTTVNHGHNYVPLSGGTMSGMLQFNAGFGIQSTVADNDFWRILGGGSSNNGYLEIATADDGSEPIYLRQYTGVFSNLVRTATLLDGNGNTSFPGAVSASSFNGNASSANLLHLPRLTKDANYQPGSDRIEAIEFSSASSNLPESNWFHVITGQGDDPAYNTQLALGMTSERMYYRNRNGGSWTSWKKIAYSNEVATKPTTSSVTCSSSSWSGSAAPYTNTIYVSGVTTSNLVEVGLSSSANDDQVKACMSASIAKITQASGSITLYAYGTKPTTDIPLSVVIIN